MNPNSDNENQQSLLDQMLALGLPIPDYVLTNHFFQIPKSTNLVEERLNELRAEDCFTTEEERLFIERIRFFAIPYGGEKAFALEVPKPSSLDYVMERIK